MHLKTRNVNTAFRHLVGMMSGAGDYHTDRDAPAVVRRPSRNGSVLQVDEPVTVTYSHPRERVLFNAARDCNPFFHLFESLWMLAGRNDVASVAYYAKQVREYSDDGGVLNGAYGYRWRHSQVPDHQNLENGDGVDQLEALVDHLKADPTSRRAVLQMWNVEDDLLKIGQPCKSCATVGKGPRKDCPWCKGSNFQDGSRDVCCNLSVMFSIRNVSTGIEAAGHIDVLDMTVTNRSNDMIWGMLGANYVHFSFLQEYMAARLGVDVGVYHHFTNNLHVYDWNWKPEEWLAAENAQPFGFHTSNPDDWGSQYRGWAAVPLVKYPAAFEVELPEFVETHSGKLAADRLENRWTEPFLSSVAGPLLTAFACHKEKADHCAFQAAGMIAADDWRIAAENWLRRRVNK